LTNRICFFSSLNTIGLRQIVRDVAVSVDAHVEVASMW